MSRWLTLLVITFITAVVFIFFFLRLRPVWTPEKEQSEAASTTATLETPTVTFINPAKGASQPKVTIVEFSDFQCPACKELATTLEVVLRTDPTVQLVWKDLPNESLHNLAVSTAIAARCAAAQGKFWEYHDAIFEDQITLSETKLKSLAQDLSLDIEKFQKCLTNQETLPLVKKDFEEGTALQITATPILFIGPERLAGAVTAEEILSVIKKQKTSETTEIK
ncbi:MAG: thioredoxin domain-containing protein [Candidatus Uhrbacteria bacterium]